MQIINVNLSVDLLKLVKIFRSRPGEPNQAQLGYHIASVLETELRAYDIDVAEPTPPQPPTPVTRNEDLPADSPHREWNANRCRIDGNCGWCMTPHKAGDIKYLSPGVSPRCVDKPECKPKGKIRGRVF